IYPDGMLHPLVFNPGERSKTLTLAPSFYDDCGQPVTFELQDGSGHLNSATAEFNRPCRRTLLERLNREFPWWPLPAIPVGAVLGYGLWRLVRRVFNGKSGTTAGHQDAAPKASDFRASWEFGDEVPGPLPDPPEIPGWPRFRCEFHIEWGGAEPPDPLPIVEPNDG